MCVCVFGVRVCVFGGLSRVCASGERDAVVPAGEGRRLSDNAGVPALRQPEPGLFRGRGGDHGSRRGYGREAYSGICLPTLCPLSRCMHVNKGIMSSFLASILFVPVHIFKFVLGYTSWLIFRSPS